MYFFLFFTGWSLGEHSEWSKFSNFEVSVNVPLILSVPEYQKRNHTGQKNGRGQFTSDVLVELVDLFPTIAELAGLNNLPECPYISQDIKLCTEGVSLVPLIDDVFRRHKQVLLFVINVKL